MSEVEDPKSSALETGDQGKRQEGVEDGGQQELESQAAGVLSEGETAIDEDPLEDFNKKLRRMRKTANEYARPQMTFWDESGYMQMGSDRDLDGQRIAACKRILEDRFTELTTAFAAMPEAEGKKNQAALDTAREKLEKVKNSKVPREKLRGLGGRAKRHDRRIVYHETLKADLVELADAISQIG